MDDENLLIRVLKFATSQEEFTVTQLFDAVKPTEVQKEQLILQINAKQLLSNNITHFIRQAREHPEKTKLYAGTEDHFRLLEYVELKEARKSAADAKNYSLWAIGISSLLAISSILVALFTEINLPKDLYDEFNKLSQKNTELTEQLTQLQQKQLAEQANLTELVEQLYTRLEQANLNQQLPQSETNANVSVIKPHEQNRQ